MRLISGTVNFKIEEPAAAALGKFDGVHLGHRKLLDRILSARDEGLVSCVFTFDPSPAVFFGLVDRELLTRDEKRAEFEELGVDYLIEYPLNRESASTEPERFVREILADQMNVRLVAAGSDLSFGRYGAGDMKLLRKMGAELGFRTEEVSKLRIGGREVSSTLVRSLVEKGRMKEASVYLGRDYSLLSGKLTPGENGNLSIGIPKEKLLPGDGMYPVLLSGCTAGGKNVLRKNGMLRISGKGDPLFIPGGSSDGADVVWDGTEEVQISFLADEVKEYGK